MAKLERNLWKETEIRALLTIIDERRILDMINEKKYRNEQIFRYVESEMCARGFTKKSYQQIWTKWKFLKSSYVTTTRHNSIPGTFPRTCDYFDLLDRILGDKQQQQPTISTVKCSDSIPSSESFVKTEIIEDENETLSFEELPEPPEVSSTPIKEIAMPTLQNMKKRPLKRKRLRLTGDIAEAFYPDIEHAEQNPQKKPIQGNYLRALKELATNLRQMQKELLTDFFQKQEELIREEHEFQRHQDEVLLKSFEEQTRLLLDSARNLLTTGVSVAPDFVYINED